MISGTADNLDGVSAAARGLGLDAKAVDNIYQRYGKTMQAQMICRMLGTTPEALKEDADKIVGGGGMTTHSTPPTSTKFPRLK